MTIVDDEVVSLNRLMDEFVFSALPLTTVEVMGQKLDMINLCLRSSTRNPAARLYWFAANRVVTEENLTGKVAGLYGRLMDQAAAELPMPATSRRTTWTPTSAPTARPSTSPSMLWTRRWIGASLSTTFGRPS